MPAWKLTVLTAAFFATAAAAAPDEVRRDLSQIAPCGSETCNARYANFGAPAQAGESAYRRALTIWRFEGAAAAVAPLELAVAEGSAAAMYRLGAMYTQGDGVPRDETRGLALVRQAAESGHPAAMLSLASAFRHGEGVAQDEAQARYWLVRAAETGYRPAMEARRRLASR
jgi:TPR repeat protein